MNPFLSRSSSIEAIRPTVALVEDAARTDLTVIPELVVTSPESATLHRSTSETTLCNWPSSKQQFNTVVLEDNRVSVDKKCRREVLGYRCLPISCDCTMCQIEETKKNIVKLIKNNKNMIKITKNFSSSHIGCFYAPAAVKVANSIASDVVTPEFVMRTMMRVNQAMFEFIDSNPWCLYDDVRSVVFEEYMPSVLESPLNRYCLTNFTKYRARRYNINVLLKALEVLNQSLIDREQLVGVEHNPGPQVKRMLSSECVERVSTKKRFHAKTNIARVLDSLKDKKIVTERAQARDQKFARVYFPEGLFEVGLDAQTRSLFEGILSEFTSVAAGVTVTHKLDVPFTDTLDSLLQTFRSLSRDVYHFVRGVIRVLATFLNESIADLVEVFLGDKFEDASEFVPEMDVSWLSVMATIYRTDFQSIIDEFSWKSFVDTLLTIKNATSKDMAVFDIVSKVVQEVSTFVCDVVGIENPFGTKDADLLRLQQEAKALASEYASGVINDYNFAERVNILQSEIEDILYSKRKNVDPLIKERLLYLLRKFQPIASYCMRFINPNNGPRVEPLAVLVAGPTGVGKSTITVPFLLALMANILPAEKLADFKKNHNDFMFFRANENEFWDGYKMRNVAVVYDDFGQLRDTVGHANADAFEIIRLKNTAPYHLHFASLEDKQRNFAVPKLIFASTNLKQIKFDSLTNSEAVARRFDLAYVQVPRPEYCTNPQVENLWERRLDLDKVRSIRPFDSSDPSSLVHLEAVEFIPWDFVRGCPTGGATLSFNDFLKLAISRFRELNDKGDMLLKFHQMMKDFRPEMDGFFDAAQDMFNPKRCLDLMLEAVHSVEESNFSRYVRAKINDVKKVEYTRVAKAFVASAVVGIGALKTATTLSNVFSRYMRKDLIDESGNSKSEVRKPNKHTRKPVSKKDAGRRSNHATARLAAKNFQGESTVNVDAYLSVLKRNMYRLEVEDREVGWVLFLSSRIFVVPRHFDVYITGKLEDDESMKVKFNNPYSGTTSMVLDWIKDLDLYDVYEGDARPYDYVFFQVHEMKCREHSDITEYFAPESRLKSHEFYQSQLMIKRNAQIIFQTPTVEFAGDTHYAAGEQLLRSRSLYYSCGTAPGDCGSPLMTSDPRLGRPTILGIHTAGSMEVNGWNVQKNCAGVFLSREEVQSVRDAFVPQKFTENFQDLSIESDLEGFNAIAQRKQPRVPDRSKIVRSQMAQYLWAPITKPAHLKAFENEEGALVDPARIARSNYSHNEVYIDDEKLLKTFYPLANLVLRKTQSPPWRPRVLSYEEAVKGIAGVDYVDGVNRSTSPGYPYVLANKSKGKKHWFGSDGEYLLDSAPAKEVESRVLSIIEDAKAGIRNEHIFIDYLKDERRPVAKVEAGKTRQFMACGMDLLISMKMYFGDFIRHICQNRVHNGVCVGINPFDEWDNLASYLSPTAETIYTAGDYSKFDARIPVPIGLLVLKVVESFYSNSTEDERNVRRVLFHEIINSMHLASGKMYEFTGGNPSGQPMTAVFNSVANLAMLIYNAACLDDQVEVDDFDAMVLRTKFAVFGDDNIVAYQPSDSAFWAQDVLEITIPKNLGMEYTNEMKNNQHVTSRDIFSISFLKRKFLLVDGRMSCPLDLDVLKETLLWERKDANLDEMKLRIECVLSEIARHGRIVFQEIAPQIVRASLSAYSYQPRNADFKIAFSAEDTLAI